MSNFEQTFGSGYTGTRANTFKFFFPAAAEA